MILEKLVTTYGSLITLILIGIGYFIKRSYDLKSKKVETSFSFFQQKKLDTIITFLENYSEAEKMWHRFPVYKVNAMTLDQLEEMIWPILHSLKVSLFELDIFLNEEEMKPYYSIQEHLLRINSVMQEIFLTDQTDENIFPLISRFQNTKENAFRQCDALIKSIGNKTRAKFYN